MRLQQGVSYLQSFCKEFTKIEQQLICVEKLVSHDLQVIETKEHQINERFRDQINECKHAKARLMSLEQSKKVHIQKSEDLSKTLKKLSDDLATVKRKIDKVGNSVTDTTPIVEIRLALQRLKTENKELDVRIGVLVSLLMFIVVFFKSHCLHNSIL